MFAVAALPAPVPSFLETSPSNIVDGLPSKCQFFALQMSASRNSSIVPWISWQNAPPNRSTLHCGTFYTTACHCLPTCQPAPLMFICRPSDQERGGRRWPAWHGFLFCQDLIAPENKCEFTATQMGVVPVQQTIFTFFGRCFIVWVWNIQVLRHLIRPANRKLGHFSTGGLSDRFWVFFMWQPTKWRNGHWWMLTGVDAIENDWYCWWMLMILLIIGATWCRFCCCSKTQSLVQSNTATATTSSCFFSSSKRGKMSCATMGRLGRIANQKLHTSARDVKQHAEAGGFKAAGYRDEYYVPVDIERITKAKGI